MIIEIGSGFIRPQKYHMIKLYPTIELDSKNFYIGKYTKDILRLISFENVGAEYKIVTYEVLRNLVLVLNLTEFRFGHSTINSQYKILVANAFEPLSIDYYGLKVFRGKGKLTMETPFEVTKGDIYLESKIKRRILK